MGDNPCTVVIDARFPPGGKVGGVETHLIALIHALGRLDGPERYLVVCPYEYPGWLGDYIGPNQRIVAAPPSVLRIGVKKILGNAAQPVWATGQKLWMLASKRLRFLGTPPGWISESNGFFEGLGATLIHVFSQTFLRTTIPTVFNPHDLQHEHYPQFFTAVDLARRKYVYLNACRSAAAVVAGSRYTRDDVIRCYHVSPEKVWTIPFGPATGVHAPPTRDNCEDAVRKYDLVRPFILYPAQTWEHKNHLRLLEAITRLRRQGVRIDLVCTGTRAEPGWSGIQRFIKENALEGQVRFPGYVSSTDLQALYKLSQFVIAPSLFEQASGPMFEAWHADVPVAASNVTSLPEQAGDAALLFDPWSVDDIADAIFRMSEDERLRESYRTRGRERLKDFSWDRTAKAYRALYRHVARWSMTEEDRQLLGWDWMAHPRRS